MSELRTLVTFQSSAFNTSERKDYFINDCCYGDDVARWFIEQLRKRDVQTDAEPGQEDFGWYFGFRVGDTDYQLAIAHPVAAATRQFGLAGLSARRDCSVRCSGRANAAFSQTALAPFIPCFHLRRRSVAFGGIMKSNSKILQIPLPGGSGRAPTGAVQFRDDWPGLFVRGDDATYAGAAIRQLQKRLSSHPDVAVTTALYTLGQLADVIEREVIH